MSGKKKIPYSRNDYNDRKQIVFDDSALSIVSRIERYPDDRNFRIK